MLIIFNSADEVEQYFIKKKEYLQQELQHDLERLSKMIHEHRIQFAVDMEELENLRISELAKFENKEDK